MPYFVHTIDMILRRLFLFALPDTKLNPSLRILISTNTILVFIMQLFVPFYAVFILRLGESIAFAGFSWALFYIVSGVLTLVLSRWEMRIKEQELLIAAGYFLRSVVFMSYVFMGSIPQLLLTQIMWGAAAALGNPAFDVVYARHTDSENSILQWGEWEGIAAIASGVAALLGGIVAEAFGFEIVFLIMAVLSFSLGLYIWRLPREIL